MDPRNIQGIKITKRKRLEKSFKNQTDNKQVKTKRDRGPMMSVIK